MSEPPVPHEGELQIEFRVGVDPGTGAHSLSMHLAGLPASVPTEVLVQTIVCCVQAALGVQIVEAVIKRVH